MYYVSCTTILPCATIKFFFFNDTATTEIYTLSLHDALPICFLLLRHHVLDSRDLERISTGTALKSVPGPGYPARSEEHTSELQSHSDLVCRLLLEKKNKTNCYQCRYIPTSSI